MSCDSDSPIPRVIVIGGSLANRQAAGDVLSHPAFLVDSASEGEGGVALVRRATRERSPYAVALLHVEAERAREAIETVRRMWLEDPDLQIIFAVCGVESFSEAARQELGQSDRYVVLQKIFADADVPQLACALVEKCRLARQERRHAREELEHAREESHPGPTHGEPAPVPAPARRALARDLQCALRARELAVHYQPLVEIAGRQVVGLEALVRWQHSRRGAVSPSQFIPVAEEHGLIEELGEFVLRRVCEQLACWAQEQVPVVRVAVNVSALQFQRPHIQPLVRHILRETGVPPQQLALELTESTLMKNARQHAKVLQGLRDDGVHIEIDDFGTGYSSLSCLKHLPVDALKIDRSFIRHLDSNVADEAIVAAILALARSLGLQAVAEGVESLAQLQVLGRHGCEIAQGFYFSRALPPERCRELLLQHGRRSSLTDTLRLHIAGAAGTEAAPYFRRMS